jgi:hypothetical protein
MLMLLELMQKQANQLLAAGIDPGLAFAFQCSHL